MPQTITRTPALAAPIVPAILERSSYSISSQSNNQVHVIVGRPDPEATLRPAGLRSGTLSLVLATRALGQVAFDAHRGVGIFQLVDTDTPSASMSYITTGTINLQLAEDGVRHRLTFGFQEVLP